MKGRELNVGERVDRPAILAIGSDIFVRHLATLFVPLEQRLCVGQSLTCSGESRNYLLQSCTSCRAGWSILLTQEFLGLSGPRHELTIEAKPIGTELFPKPSRSRRIADSVKKFSIK